MVVREYRNEVRFPRGSVGKESTNKPGDAEDMCSIPGSGRSPGRGQPTPVFMPGESNGQRSLAGYHSWTHKESDTTESTEHIAHTDLDLSFLLNCVMLGNLHWESQNSMNCYS